jgi:hypothetical protein
MLRKLLYSVLIIVTSSITVFAHGTSLPSQVGGIDYSTYWVVTSGIQTNMLMYFNANKNLSAYEFYEVVERYNAGQPGLDSLIEATVLPGLAVGAIVNVPQLLLNGLQGGTYALTAAATVDWKWYSENGLRLGSRLEAEADPLIGGRSSFDQGLYNIFLTFLGSSYRIVDTPTLDFVAYGDAKFITSLMNNAYRTYEEDFESMFMLQSGSTSALPHTVGPMYKFVFAPGLEARFDKFILSLGFNLPMLEFNQTRVTRWPFDFEGVDLTNLEFSWRFRL